MALSAPAKDQMECFVVDRQGRVWHQWYLDKHWSDWASLGEPEGMSAPIAISALNGEERHQELFAVGASGQVAHRWHWQGEAWDDWYVIPSQFSSRYRSGHHQPESIPDRRSGKHRQALATFLRSGRELVRVGVDFTKITPAQFGTTVRGRWARSG